MVIFLSILLALCFLSLAGLFYLQQKSFQEQRAADKTFFREVMNRLMSQTTEDYLTLAGEKLPDNVEDNLTPDDNGVPLENATINDFVKVEENEE